MNILFCTHAGAHTIGTTACFFMPRRLYGFNSTSDSDPRISPQFLPELRRTCPKNGDTGARISLDPVTPGRFDSQVMDNIKTGFAVLASDAQLYNGSLTREVVDSYAGGSRYPHPVRRQHQEARPPRRNQLRLPPRPIAIPKFRSALGKLNAWTAACCPHPPLVHRRVGWRFRECDGGAVVAGPG
ncbi:hypothetical protein SASPL_104141 [Salvia splendens]|uniref:peroxidase n=1 Tax=Salvia splendens TaxID=180675 RepID=A0A8X8YHF1_SALSN|nr:hypothetical protein SASPL_104141 [Salvia splendens]